MADRDLLATRQNGQSGREAARSPPAWEGSAKCGISVYRDTFSLGAGKGCTALSIWYRTR